MSSELRHRDPLLFWIGAAMMLTLIVCALLSIGDKRLILGINPWIKPMKFLVSVTIFLWTVAWFMPETRPALDPAAGRQASGRAMDDRPGDDHRDRLHHHAGRARHDLALQQRDAVRRRWCSTSWA